MVASGCPARVSRVVCAVGMEPHHMVCVCVCYVFQETCPAQQHVVPSRCEASQHSADDAGSAADRRHRGHRPRRWRALERYGRGVHHASDRDSCCESLAYTQPVASTRSYFVALHRAMWRYWHAAQLPQPTYERCSKRRNHTMWCDGCVGLQVRASVCATHGMWLQ